MATLIIYGFVGVRFIEPETRFIEPGMGSNPKQDQAKWTITSDMYRIYKGKQQPMESFKITVDKRDFLVICFPNRPKALLDRTVAEIYEVQTMHINQAVKNNSEKFPEDFCFELTPEEVERLLEIENCGLKSDVIKNFDNIGKSIDFNKLKYSPHLPKAFTHLGCNMLATILKSKRAVQRAIQIIQIIFHGFSTDFPQGRRDYANL